jgi:hypothetical protein
MAQTILVVGYGPGISAAVAEVLVAGPVKGTAIEKAGVGRGRGPAIEPASIADTFWRLFERRDEIRARVEP